MISSRAFLVTISSACCESELFCVRDNFEDKCESISSDPSQSIDKAPIATTSDMPHHASDNSDSMRDWNTTAPMSSVEVCHGDKHINSELSISQ
jgi:hypothetical protein